MREPHPGRHGRLGRPAACARRRPGHGRLHGVPCGAAAPVGPDARADARSDHRGQPVRGLGEDAGGGDCPRGERPAAVRFQPPPSRDRPDVGNHHPVDAGQRRAQRPLRHRHVLDALHGYRQGAAARRLRRDGDGEVAVDEPRSRAAASPCRPSGRRHRRQEHRRAGGADGRRDAQPQQGEQRAADRRAGAAPGRGGRGWRSGPRAQVHRGRGALHPQPRHGGEQGHHGRGRSAFPSAPSSPRSRATGTRPASG